jgi:hypothetical protein
MVWHVRVFLKVLEEVSRPVVGESLEVVGDIIEIGATGSLG